MANLILPVSVMPSPEPVGSIFRIGTRRILLGIFLLLPLGSVRRTIGDAPAGTMLMCLCAIRGNARLSNNHVGTR